MGCRTLTGAWIETASMSMSSSLSLVAPSRVRGLKLLSLIHIFIPLIEGASRPVIYAGGGIISAEASADLLEFAERSQIPVATTLMGIGCLLYTSVFLASDGAAAITGQVIYVDGGYQIMGM